MLKINKYKKPISKAKVNNSCFFCKKRFKKYEYFYEITLHNKFINGVNVNEYEYLKLCYTCYGTNQPDKLIIEKSEDSPDIFDKAYKWCVNNKLYDFIDIERQNNSW
jgi:hypothetical protein